MNMQMLVDTACKLVADDKGVLAMDESNPTCNKRFAKLNIPQTVEARRAYRELIVTAPGLGESISGAILFDETIRQQKKDGTPFLKVLADEGIIPGIKVDTGAKDLAAHPGEKITEGLDGLRDRLKEYFQMGARFAKWRAVIVIGDGLPSRGCLEANAQALARDYRPAFEQLLEIVRRDRKWNEEAGRKTMLTLFTMLGAQPEYDDLVREFRVALSRTLN